MYDKKVVLEILQQIHEAAQRVIARFEPVAAVEDFTSSEDGMGRLDSICMVLIAIGESLKNIDKITDKSLLSQYPEIDWKGAMGMRDIITHHYFDVDAEEIFWVCTHQIRPLADTIAKIIRDLD
ncbi:MAG: HepT-like ribonuclease domain-containing protein [Planctomycetota bacterium]|jgi:uncharacterized protein with HEPN domain